MSAIFEEISEMGPYFTPDVANRTRALFTDLIDISSDNVQVHEDIAYGGHPRQQLDIYAEEKSHDQPVLVYIPGGGFTGGDKRMTPQFYANIGHWFASRGFICVIVNYRLAPEFVWPSGSQDVSAALNWVRQNIGKHGGDSERIFAFGQSAGATHLATSLFDPSIEKPKSVMAAVLMSGVYSVPKQETSANILAYFGADRARHEEQVVLPHAHQTTAPILLAVAQYDPAFLSLSTYELAAALTRRDQKPAPFYWLPLHNHSSAVLGIGSPDDSLGQRIIAFFEEVAGRRND